MTDMEQFVETKIYCQVSRYAETVQVNCLLEQNQGKRKLKLWNKVCQSVCLLNLPVTF